MRQTPTRAAGGGGGGREPPAAARGRAPLGLSSNPRRRVNHFEIRRFEIAGEKRGVEEGRNDAVALESPPQFAQPLRIARQIARFCLVVLRSRRYQVVVAVAAAQYLDRELYDDNSSEAEALVSVASDSNDKH